MECMSNFSSAIQGRDELQEESGATTTGYKFYSWLVYVILKVSIVKNGGRVEGRG